MYSLSIRAARVNAGLTQKEAAERLGISDRTLLNWEQGSSRIPAGKMAEMAAVYEIPKCFFFSARGFDLIEQN